MTIRCCRSVCRSKLVQLIVATGFIVVCSLYLRVSSKFAAPYSTRDRSNDVHAINKAAPPTTAGCTVNHVGLRSGSAEDTRMLVELLQMMLYHSPHAPFVMHVSAHDQQVLVLRKLLATWELTHVSLVFYPFKSPRLYDAIPAIVQNLPSDVDNIVFLDVKMRLTTRVEQLLRYTQAFDKQQVVGYVTSQRTNARKDCLLCIHDVLVLNAPKARRVLPALFSSETSPNALEGLGSEHLYKLPPSWFVELEADFPFDTIRSHGDVDAYRLSGLASSYISNLVIEEVKEHSNQILNQDHDMFGHHDRHRCPIKGGQTLQPQPRFENLSCPEYRHYAHLSKRLHLYYLGSRPPSSGDHDVSLLTQLTVDRLSSLDLMASRWLGPIHALVYATDADARKLLSHVATSNILKKRNNIAYHVLYKRQKYYPINYIRNVLLNVTTTPYLLFNDVDLIPSKNVYERIKTYIPTHMTKPNTTLVVPAFELHTNTEDVPANRSQLLQFMQKEIVTGYRMKMSWNLGHVATNYPKWKTATEPYMVPYRGAFEPYLVLASKTAPQYDERLLERMGDKIAYGVEIYARGYEMIVLHDVFIVHVPHPKSEGTKLWQSNSGYFNCGAKLHKEFRNDLAKKYPGKKVT